LPRAEQIEYIDSGHFPSRCSSVIQATLLGFPKITHISKSIGTIPPAVLPSSIKAPSISGLPSGEGSEDDAIGTTSDEESSDD